MGPALVVKNYSALDSHLQMAIVNRDQEVQALAARASDEPFTDRVRPERPSQSSRLRDPSPPYPACTDTDLVDEVLRQAGRHQAHDSGAANKLVTRSAVRVPNTMAATSEITKE